MRFFSIFLIALVLASYSVLAATVSRDMPARVSPGETVTVTFNIANAESGKSFTLEDDIPDDWTFSTWEVTGSAEQRSGINVRASAGNRHGWSFTVANANMQIKYTAKASSKPGNADFDAVWFDPSGQARDKRTIVVRVITCGDGVCESSETSDNCEKDCPKPAPAPVPAPTPVTTPAPEPIRAPVEPAQSYIPIILVVGVVAIVGIAAFLMMRKKQGL